MATITFDTLGAKRILTDAGFEDKPAIAVVDVAHKSVSENVATKEDIANLKVDHVNLKLDLKGDIAGLKRDIVDLRTELKTDIANLKVHMTLGLLASTGIIIAAMGVMIAAFTFLGN